ncbi:MAG: citrate lyase acyl carrier protein [Cetobacterium sp.]|uniref:citrate lyase acyl carrier protein n=1 Tax=Cetobacterium TaxID=180162 RepID=UPI00163BA7BD|nr:MULTISPECIES: citrate lyase acyl carrier protein [Cetobacterium]MBC2853159.1 citrate lyase acyl carrier protein [Cetobacterium sp. 2G large]MCX3066329.1 citrate lyase acyl carrier protein [Cetobacterium somerae]UPO96803.1 citrate lyase acyl carrier protein [Cetobacterium somerae]
MTINKPAKCGTLESNDIFIMLTPSENGISIELESVVEKQFGNHIKMVIEEKLKEMGITSVLVKAQDKGALDYTIRARIEGAVKRGC